MRRIARTRHRFNDCPARLGDPVGGAGFRHWGIDRLRGSLGAAAGRRQRGTGRHGSAASAVHDGSEDCRGLRWARRVLRSRFNPCADCGRRSRDLSWSDHLRGSGIPDSRFFVHAGGARRNAPAVTIDALVLRSLLSTPARLRAAAQSAALIDCASPAGVLPANTKLASTRSGLFQITPGSDLLSHTPARAVPSAVAGLTSVFGMGTGVTLLL